MTNSLSFDKRQVLGHPVGLFVLFFTEMWERFSYYGMRIILVLFLTSAVSDGGYGWSRADALKLYGWYTGLVYLTPIFGGILADRVLGFRLSVVIGALLMTLGHVALALEDVSAFYIGLGLLIIGNGFFKPNIASIVGQLYPEGSPIKDSAYTIFYMAVNAGAFLGMLICGYLGETVSWSYGFGAAGIFMFFGMLQFHFGQKIFGNIGTQVKEKDSSEKPKEEKKPLTREEGDRLWVIGILAFFIVFFWMAFEQAGGTLNIFARDYTARGLSGDTAISAFRYVSVALTFIPIIILTWVIYELAAKIYKDYPLTIFFTSLSFLIIWGIVIWINNNNFSNESLEVPASWFGTLNGFFIITLGPLFSTMWMRLNKANRNPSGPVKFAIGLILLGVGFGGMAYGASTIPQGAQAAQVSMIWLIWFYFFQTVGELFISPVGLSYVSRLSPVRLVGMMFGVFYIANFIANFLAGYVGSAMDRIGESYSLSQFFLLFMAFPIAAGLLIWALNKPIKWMMHGVH